MPSSVAEELKRHVGAFPPVEVEPPWGKPEADGQRRKSPLLLTTRFGNAVAVNVAVNAWNAHTWKPALAKAGIIPSVTMLTSCRRPGARGGRPSMGCWADREICMPVETPQILPRADDGRFPLLRASGAKRGFHD
jgi:hypothetical protein